MKNAFLVVLAVALLTACEMYSYPRQDKQVLYSLTGTAQAAAVSYTVADGVTRRGFVAVPWSRYQIAGKGDVTITAVAADSGSLHASVWDGVSLIAEDDSPGPSASVIAQGVLQ